MESNKTYQTGKLYQYDGSKFVELEPSGETKLPVSPEAMEAVKQVRKAAQKLIGMRPELSLTASAMLLAAAELSNVAEAVQKYGQRVYSKVDSSVDNPVVNEATAGDKAGQGLDSNIVNPATGQATA